MNVLLLGSGGREHTLAWKISQSKKLNKLFVAPGNAGTEKHGVNVNLNPLEFEAVKEFVLKEDISMLVVGPEEPLVKGIADFFIADADLEHVGVIGPNAAGAKLEGSKQFSKEFMTKYNIPTAAFQSFTKETLDDAIMFLDKLSAPYVLKADGLAAGKGVLILNDKEQAIAELKEMFEGKFGEASKTVVIEEFISGIELSVFVLTDGKSYKILPEAKDYKRIGEGDTGLNTGGMGSISPVPFANAEFIKKVEDRVVIPTIDGLNNEGIDYKGFIFIGLMNVNGNPIVIEYNVRMGDPETESVIPRLKSDILDLFNGVVTNSLSEREIEIDNRTVASVIMVSGGYPEDYEKGKEITGIENVTESIVFHAGTKRSEGRILSNGGRVLAISSYGNTMAEALEKSYKSVSLIDYDKKYFRKDLGFDLK